MISRSFQKGLRNLLLLFLFSFVTLAILSRCVRHYSIEPVPSDDAKMNDFIDLMTAVVDQPVTSSQPAYLTVEDIANAEVQPDKDGKNVFFIDTSRMRKKMMERPFTSRQACAVESAGK